MCGAWGAVQAACCVDMAGRAAPVSSWLVSSNPAEASGWRLRPCLWLCRLYSLTMRMAKATKHLDVQLWPCSPAACEVALVHRQGRHLGADAFGCVSPSPGAPNVTVVVCAAARRSGRSRNRQISPALGPAPEEAEAAPASCCVCMGDGHVQEAAEGGPMLRCISCPATCHERCAPEGCSSRRGSWCCGECSAAVEQAEITHGAVLRWARGRFIPAVHSSGLHLGLQVHSAWQGPWQHARDVHVPQQRPEQHSPSTCRAVTMLWSQMLACVGRPVLVSTTVPEIRRVKPSPD